MEGGQDLPPGKKVFTELTNPSWQPLGEKNEGAGKRAITGFELDTLIKGAAFAAWKTFAFHATKSENVGSILTGGLDPRRGGTGAGAISETFQEHSRGHVHYARNYGTADAYRDYFAGGTPFGPSRANPAPAPAEILQVALGKTEIGNEEQDPDSPSTDRAYRTTDRIQGENIRRIRPADLPAPRKAGRKGRLEPLQPGANEAAWRDHMNRMSAEQSALLSNLPSSATNVLWDLHKRGLNISYVLSTVMQALRSLPTDQILAFAKENWDRNPRVRQNVYPTGIDIPHRPLK
jgi:hypothetical protein